MTTATINFTRQGGRPVTPHARFRVEGRLEEGGGSYRAALARLLLVALSFASINSALTGVVSAEHLSNHWYLYVSPVLVAALSFGLRGGLLASAVAIVALAALDVRMQSFMAERQAHLQGLVAQLSLLSQAADPAPAGGFLGNPERLAGAAVSLSQDAWGFSLYTMQSLAGVAVLSLLGGIVGWQVDQGRHQRDALLALARQDTLTGALSRSVWLEALDHEVIRARRGGRPFAILLADVDGLEVINRRLGRATGNEALRHLVGVMQPQVRATDRLGRLGGDEFGVLLLDADLDAATKVAQRFLTALEAQPLQAKHGHAVDLGLSMGLAAYPGNGTTAELLIAAAEDALGRARASGGRTSAVPGGAEAAAGSGVDMIVMGGPHILPLQAPTKGRSRGSGHFADRLE